MVSAAAFANGALAQTSASYKLQESVLNAGGVPTNGSVLSSAGFRIRLDSIGEGLVRVGMLSTSFRMDGGFVDVYRPPGEVLSLRCLSDKQTLQWSPEVSAGTYAVYRSTLGSLPGTFGDCLPPTVSGASASDTGIPSVDTGYFYLVTARNRLGEEGTKGSQSNGTPRPNPASCP